jgi:hypothetical protein
MQRREFLKLSGAAFGSTVLLLGLPQLVGAMPVETQAGDKRFRGYNHDGDIFISHDAGETWQLHTRLGSEYSISDFVVDYSDRVYVKVGFKGYHFHLVLSQTGDKWKTV